MVGSEAISTWKNTPPRPEIGNLRKMMNGGINNEFIASMDTKYEPQKRPLVSEKPSATPSGVNSFSPVKVIMDLRNGITCEVLLGHE